MLTRLAIVDFQAHKQLTLDFDSAMTTIVGGSDRGKSAVLRALRWVATNSPAGEAFVRDGARMARVRLCVDGHVVKRARGRGRNTYVLDGQRLQAFGSGVPAAVGSLLSVGDVNFQGQHDAPFWFACTSGEVSRQINEVVDLGLVDVVLGRLGAWVRETNSRVAICTERLEVAQADRRRERGWLVADQALRRVEALEAEAAEAQRRAVQAAELVERARQLGQRAERAAQGGQAALSAYRLGVAWRAAVRRAGALQALLGEIGGLRGRAAVVVPPMGHLTDLGRVAARAEACRRELSVLVHEIGTAQVRLAAAEQACVAAGRMLDRAMGPACPLCGQRRKRGAQ